MDERQELAALRRMAELEAKSQTEYQQLRAMRGRPPAEALDPNLNPMFPAGHAALIGAGRAGKELEEGTRQLGLNATVAAKELMGRDTRPELDAIAQQDAAQSEDARVYAGLRKQFPLASGLGEALPALAIPAGQATMGARVMAPALGFGAMGAAKYGSPKERAVAGVANAGVGALGGVAGELLGSAISPAASRLTGAQQDALATAAGKIGVQPLPSQMTGNPNLARIEDFLSRVQGGAGVMQDFQAGNKAAVNRYSAKAMGENTDAITKDVFAAADDRIGAGLDDLRSKTNMPVVQPVFDAITASEKMLQTGLGKVAGKDEAVALLGELKDRLYSTKALSGAEYQSIASDLKTAARETKNQTIAAALSHVRKAMDDVAQGPNAPQWKQLNSEYAAMKSLMKPGAVNEATGDVNPVALGTRMDTQFRDAMKTGAINGPLADVAAYGKALPPMRPGSPTFERGAAGNLMDWFLSPAYWAGAKAMTSGLGRDYLSGGLLGSPKASNVAGLIGSRAAMPLAMSPAEQILFQMGLLGYSQ